LGILEGRLKTLGIAPLGDLFSADVQSVQQTVDSVNSLIDMVIQGMDDRIRLTREVNTLTVEVKNLQRKVGSMRQESSEELTGLQSRLKGAMQTIGERKRQWAGEKADLEANISSLEGKIRQLGNEGRKKDMVIRALGEKVEKLMGTKGRVINGDVSISGGQIRGEGIYTDGDIRNIGNLGRDRELRTENTEMREIIAEVHRLLWEGVEKRKALGGTGVGIQLRKEVLGLRVEDYRDVSAGVLKENISALFRIMDEIDHCPQGISGRSVAQMDEQLEGIVEVKKLQKIIGSLE